MAYDNNMSGMIAVNQRKTQTNHPDYSGQGEVDGKPVWISGWKKTGKPGTKMEGKPFLSLAFKFKDQQQAPAPEPPPAPSEDQDIPF